MYVGENLDFAFGALHCGVSRYYHNAPLLGWPTSQSANTMTVTGHDCQASKAADRNLCIGVKISIFPLTRCIPCTEWPVMLRNFGGFCMFFYNCADLCEYIVLDAMLYGRIYSAFGCVCFRCAITSQAQHQYFNDIQMEIL